MVTPEPGSGLEQRYNQYQTADKVFETTDGAVARVLIDQRMFGFYSYNRGKEILEDTNINFLPRTSPTMQLAHQDQYMYYACAYGLLRGLRDEQEEECRGLMRYMLIGDRQGLPIDGSATEGVNKKIGDVRGLMNILHQAGIAHIPAARIVRDFCIALYTKQPRKSEVEKAAGTLRERVKAAEDMKAERELSAAILRQQIDISKHALKSGDVDMMKEAVESLRHVCSDIITH